MFVIAVEDSDKGLRIYGPFATPKEAEDYAWKKFDEENNDVTWWIKKVRRPNHTNTKPTELKQHISKGVTQCEGSQSS